MAQTATIPGGVSGKRRPRYVKLLLALAIVLALVGLPVLALDLVGRSALERELEAIRATGAPVTLEEVNALRVQVPDEENALLQLASATPDLKRIWAAAHRRYSTSQALGDLLAVDPGEPYPAEGLAAVEALLDQAGDLPARIDALRNLKRGRLPMDVLDPQMSASVFWPIEAALELKEYDVILKIRTGQMDEAVLASVTMLHIGAAVRCEPMIWPYFRGGRCEATALRTLERVLAAGTCSEETLGVVREAIKEALASSSVTRVLQAERAGMIDRHERAGQGAPCWEDEDGRERKAPWPYRYFRGLRWLGLAKALSLMRPVFDSSGSLKTFTAAAEAYDYAVFYDDSPEVGLARLASPMFRGFPTAVARRVAWLRCADVALAVEGFRLRHGDWPSTPEVLVPGYLDAWPVDPFDDQPVRYRRTDGGILIYSTSQYEQDDGDGVTPGPARNDQAPDLGFRLFDPTLRGFTVAEDEDDNGWAE